MMLRRAIWIQLLLCVMICHCANGQNHDESKVPRYSLPDPLRAIDGTKITHLSAWEKKRRPEVLRLFEEHVYGEVPSAVDSVRYRLVNEDTNAMNGRAHLKEVSIVAYRSGRSVNIGLVLFIPKNHVRPVPVFLFINNRDRSNTDPRRDTISEFWPAEMLIDSGYAISAFHVSDAAPDNKDSFANGVLQLYPDQVNADNGMRAIGAWGWAASRAMDYFEQDPSVHAKKVAIVGHSRGGKAALWAGAQDRRFAIVISNNSGNTGAALARRRFGETIAVINTAFPHWFADNYKKYNDRESELPIDQHLLIALIAPRPVYVTSATRDLWADPKGSFLALKHAEDIYKLYGKQSKLPVHSPPPNVAVTNSIIAYHNRVGDHDLTKFDWTRFVEFANFHFR